MYTLLKPIKVREELLGRGVRIFTPLLFTRIFDTPAYVTKYFLERQTQEGFFIRLKQGLYTLKTDPPSEEEIANALYQPSYISFEYALAYHNILPEMPYTVTSATTKPTRLFTTKNAAYSYRTIKSSAFTGYFLERKENKSFLIAEPEKAFADYLYFVSLRKSTQNDRLVVRALQKDKLLGYIHLFKKDQLNKLIKDIYDIN